MTTAIVKDAYQDVQVAAAYDRERFTSVAGRVFDSLEKRAIRQVLGPVVRREPALRVLDIPCGTGRITRTLLEMGLTVTGGDISQAMMEVAGRRCAQWAQRLDFRQLDLDGLDLPAGSFDLVTCIRLLHHLDSDARASVYRQIARVSRRWVLVNVSYSSPYYRLRRKVKRVLGQGISRQSCTAAEIVREIGAAGLRIVGQSFVLPGVSEDLLLLMEKASSAAST